MGARLELLDCNRSPANIKSRRILSPMSRLLEKLLSSELSKSVEFPSLLPFRVCGYRKNPTAVEVSNIPELLQRLRWCPIGERKPQVKCWRKSPHITKLLKLLRYPN